MDPALNGKTNARIARSMEIRATVEALDRQGTKPTSRNVLARMAGHDNVKAFPQGMGGTDLLVFRDAMRDNGYAQVNSMWKKQVASVGLDEVLCDCPVQKTMKHVMTDHEEVIESLRTDPMKFMNFEPQPFQERYLKIIEYAGKGGKITLVP